jgi:hypothetical protein
VTVLAPHLAEVIAKSAPVDWLVSNLLPAGRRKWGKSS